MIKLIAKASIAGWMAAIVMSMLIPVPTYAMEGDLSTFKLPNGLRVLVKEDHSRKVAALQLWVLVGSADEERSEGGISHLIEHMAFKGTKRRGLGQIASEVENLGGEINAYTSWDETVFHITVPSSATAQGLDILTDAVLRPVIDAKELAKEKQVVLEEILEGEERPARKASKLLFDTAYTTSLYKYPIIGYKEVVEKFTRDDILAFRKKWYVPENMFLLVVGDVKPDQVREEAQRLTADFKPQGFFRPARPSEPVQKEIRSSLIRDNNAREARLNLAFHIPSSQGNDVNAVDLAADILGARESSRLVRVLKKEKGLVNSIYASAVTPKDPGLLVIAATLDITNMKPVTQAIMEELAKLAAEPPSKEELERAKTHIESEHIYARETVQGMSRAIGSYMADLGDPLYEQKYLRLNQQVTPDQISETVKNYLSAPNITVSVLVPEENSKDFRVEELAAIVGAPGQGPAGPVVASAASPKAVTRTLSNGLKLVIVPDKSNPVVSFRIAHLGGKRFENKEDEGIMNFIARMLNKGTTKLSEVEISRKVEDMGGKMAGFSGYDSFGLSCSFFSRYADQGLQLLAQLSSDVAFPEDKLERERTLIINTIKTQPDRPIQYAINALNRTIFTEHPYGFDKDGTIETVSGFTRNDLKKVYERYAVPSNTVITVVGDVNSDKMITRIEQLFGKLPDTKLVAPPIPKEKPITSVRDAVIRIPRAKAHIAIGFRGTTMDDKDRYALDVLNNILAGQGGRLFLQLRDKESLAYTVTSFVRPGLDPGVFAFYIATDPSKASRAVEGLFEEIDRIKQAPVNAEELSRAISNLTGNHLIHLQSTWARSENKALNTLYGLGYDFDTKYLETISRVKADEVLNVARKYLDIKRCVTVKIVPEQETRHSRKDN